MSREMSDRASLEDMVSAIEQEYEQHMAKLHIKDKMVASLGEELSKAIEAIDAMIQDAKAKV